MTWAVEIEFALNWQWRSWCATLAPFDRWHWGRETNLFDNVEYHCGPLTVTRLA